jgi:membrane fusion protein (multidrug efflux system)
MTSICYRLLIILFSLASLNACKPATSEQGKGGAAGMQPVAITSMVAEKRDIPVRYKYVGQVAGSLEVDVRSRITGIIEQRHYREGGTVHAGQLLFSLDAASYEAVYQQALAAVESARAQKLSAGAQLKKARRELKRVTPLTSQNMLSQNTEDDAVSAVEIASAQLAVSEAAIKLAEANLLTASINLEYTKIKSPIDGIAGRALLNRGALVQVGSNSLLTTLVQVDSVHVDFGIPENDKLRMRAEQTSGILRLPESGLRVEILDAEGQLSGRNGEIDFQDYKVDNSTGNFAMRALLDNADGGLSPGQFVRVALIGAIKVGAIAVPQRAVLDGPAGKYVYVVSPGQNGMTVAMQKNVTLGEWIDLDAEHKNYWILRSGLEPGDEVIVDGVARIFFPGMPVQTATPEALQQPAQEQPKG